jgi:Cytochrome C biogenesis protein transmembrane region
MRALVEPVLLGFSSGLVCLASCGPVLLPALAAAGGGWRGTGALLGLFLAGRLAGYLGFAAAAWALGLALPLPARSSAWVFGVVHLALAAALLLFVLLPRRPRAAPCPEGRGLRARVALARRCRAFAPAAMGLLTGLNLCPPFVVAGVRAAEAPSLAAALGFFVLFFVGTTVWFLPFLGLAPAGRLTAVGTVARFTAVVVAAYYAYLGAVTLGGALIHG